MALLVQAHPDWTVLQIRTALLATAGDYAANHAFDPLYVRGYGVINAMRAYTIGCPADYNGDLFVDGIDYDQFNNDFESSDPDQQRNADYNGDGFVDGIDYDQFNNAFEHGDQSADFNGDGFVDGIDYDGFNNAFEAGC